MALPENRVIITKSVQRDSTFASSGLVVSHLWSIPHILRWSFLLLAVTLSFESADLTLMSGTLSPAKISGYLFFCAYVLYHNPLTSGRSLPHPPHAMWWFLGYIVVYALNGVAVTEEFAAAVFSGLFTLLQLAVFFWILSDLLKNPNMARTVLLIFSIASVILALGIMLHIPGFSVTTEAQGRVSALGDGLNSLGTLMGVSAVIVIGLSLNNELSQFTRKLLLPVFMLPLLVVMVNTGSRGAMLAFIVGCCVYLLPHWRSKPALTVVILALLGILGVAQLVATNPDAWERWQLSYYEGHTAGRDEIYAAAIEMILERPIFGWRPVEFWYELGFREGKWGRRDAHNLYLHVLLEVGLVGAIPFFVGLGLCARAAWRARHGNLRLLPLALLVTLLASNMSGTYLNLKLLWLALALACATASAATEQRNIFLVRRTFPSKA